MYRGISLPRHMRHRRIALILTTLAAALFLSVVWIRPRVREPDIRLTRLLPVAPAWAQASDGQNSLPFSGMADSGSWKAEFRFGVPQGSGMVLSNGTIGVELLASDGHLIEKAEFREHPLPVSLPLPHYRTTSRGDWLFLPPQATSCRFTVGYRLPTLQERFETFLNQLGFWHHFPKTSTWIWRHMPTTERWLLCHRDVQLAVPPTQLQTQTDPSKLGDYVPVSTPGDAASPIPSISVHQR